MSRIECVDKNGGIKAGTFLPRREVLVRRGGFSRERPDARHIRSALDRAARTGVDLGVEHRRDGRYGGRGI